MKIDLAQILIALILANLASSTRAYGRHLLGGGPPLGHEAQVC